MDWSKVDPGLAAAAGEGHPRNVVVRVLVRVSRPPTSAEAVSAGLDPNAVADRPVFSATAPLLSIEHLSEQPWVRSVTLSKTLHPRAT